MKIVFAAAFVLAFGPVVMAQVSSVYTALDDKKCKELERTDEEGGSYRGLCPGAAGYKLELIEGDLRQTVTIVDPKGKKHPLEFWNLTGAFNAVGETAEWRMRGKKPIALIVRLTVNERVDDPAYVKSYLVVAKITPESTCVTHFLAPTRSHNFEARKAADRSASRQCLKSASD